MIAKYIGHILTVGYGLNNRPLTFSPILLALLLFRCKQNYKQHHPTNLGRH